MGNGLEGSLQRRAYDQISYNLLAQSLMEGKGYSFRTDWYPFTPADTQTAHWSFLYPLYLAGVYSILGYSPLAARLVQVLISGLLTTILCYKLGTRFGGTKVGLLTALLYALYAYFIFYDATLMTESFFTLGVLGSLYLAMKLTDREFRSSGRAAQPKNFLTWVFFGLLMGFTIVLRQTFLVWLPIMFIWMIVRDRQRWYHLLIPTAIIATCILPWTVRNYSTFHEFLPLNSNSGYALYSSNHPNQGVNFDQDYAAPLPGDLISQGLNEAQWNSQLTLRAFGFVLADPQRYLLLSLDRIPIFFNFWFSAESDRNSNLMRIFSYGLYLPFMVYGVILSLRDWRKYSLVYLFGILFSVMHIMSWASIRYRLPIDALFLPFAAMAILHLGATIRQWIAPVNGTKKSHQAAKS
jgi:4-amino-4-deoxy-L-arabinose transferase-like glycosyltransferase